MANNASNITPFTLPPIPALAGTAKPEVQAGPNEQPRAAPAADPQASAVMLSADCRLVIDEDPKSGTFIYKTVNRVTGEVIYQVPREELLRLRDSPIYEAGSVVKTSA